MSTTTPTTFAAETRHAWTTRKGVEASYVLGHADPSCRRAAEGDPAEAGDDAWPCGSCIAVEVNPEHVSIREASAFRPGGAVSERERQPVEPSEPDPEVEEAVAFAKSYEGGFEFMVEMRKRCSKGLRLTPNQVAAILRCKARAERTEKYRESVEGAAKADPNVRPNRYAGPCGTCRSEVAENAGRIEQVGGRWVAFHLAGGCPPEAPQSDGEAREAAQAPSTAPDVSSVPEGRYALTAKDGHVVFYKVDRPTDGKWAGYVFASQLVGSPGDFSEQRLSRERRSAVLAEIALDVQGAAVLFARKTRRCGRCLANHSLTQSRAAGFGSTCAKKLGWYYPTKAEARAILDEQQIDTEGVEDLD